MSHAPTCGVRETLAFWRDPARFTGGAGLGLGDLYRVRLPRQRLWVVTDPALVERVLVRDEGSFRKGRLYWEALRSLMGVSMGATDGEPWAFLHSAQRRFFTPRAVEGHLSGALEQVALHLDRLAVGAGTPSRVRVLDSLAVLNARVTLAVLLGRDHEEAATELAARVVDGHALVARAAAAPWPALTTRLDGTRRTAAEHRRFFDRWVEEVRRGHDPSADRELLLDALLRIEDDPDAPVPTDDVVRNEIVFHLGASIETMAAAEAWMLLLLSRHPWALERVVGETMDAAGGRPPGPGHVDALPWTRQVVEESLRLYPSVHAVVRDCVRAVELGGERVRPGDAVFVSVHGLHRNPRLWEVPDAFRPSRFGPGGEGVTARYRYLPFGAGRHVCLGRHLAIPVMVLTVARFTRRFEWSFPDPVRAETRPSLKPAPPFEAVITLREDAPRVSGGRRG